MDDRPSQAGQAETATPASERPRPSAMVELAASQIECIAGIATAVQNLRPESPSPAQEAVFNAVAVGLESLRKSYERGRLQAIIQEAQRDLEALQS